MKAWFSLTVLYLRAFYSLPGAQVAHRGAFGKTILKPVGILLLGLVVIGSFGFMFVVINLGMYESLAPQGFQSFLLPYAVLMITVLTFVLGFLFILSTYFLNESEVHLLALPIHPRSFLGAKFMAVWVAEALFSLFFMGITMGVYGFKEGPNPLFYLWGTIAALLIPLLPLALAWAVLVPLMAAFRFLRSKQTAVILGGLIGLGFSLGFNFYFQGFMMNLVEPAQAATTPTNSLFGLLARGWPPAMLTWQAMTDPASLPAFGAMFSLVLGTCGLTVLVVILLGPSYVKRLHSFNEVRIRRLATKEQQVLLSRRLAASTPFRALFLREIRSMNREPVWLLNGPFIIVLMPVILGLVLAVQKDAIVSDPDIQPLLELLRSGGGLVVAALTGAFLASSTSITCTSISRDAKVLGFLKSLPVDAGILVLAKLTHGMIFGVFGSLTGVVLVAWAIGLDPAHTALALASSLALGFLFNTLGLFLDLLNPHLRWDNPVAAVKQNPNAVILILGVMALVGLSAWAVFVLGIPGPLFAVVWGLGSVLGALLTLAAGLPWARHRLSTLES